jgi:glycine dehydrogenase subunit 1
VPALPAPERGNVSQLSLTDSDREEMLAAIGVASVDELFRDIPAGVRFDRALDLEPALSEPELVRHLEELAAKNVDTTRELSFLGMGIYDHYVPAVVDAVLQRGEFLTAYTPYQPEIAQGTLQMMFEFQSQVARLLGCDVANASMYDGSTACWEAIVMARRVTRRGKAILSGGLHPHYVSVARTMAKFTGDQLVTSIPALTPDPDTDDLIGRIDDDTSCVVVQYPDILGRIADLSKLAEACHARKALLVAVVTEPVALGAIRSPGEMGADIVVGEGQSIGVGLQFGGPYVGLFACSEKLVRQMPGRLCGETEDAEGKRGYVLTLSTREQHIRREKATSNICTSSVLCALAFSIHMTLLGEKGLRQLAAINHQGASAAADVLAGVPGVELVTPAFFNEFTLKLSKEARPVVRDLAHNGILAGVSLGRLYPGESALANGLVVAVTETTTREDVETLASALREALA